MPIKCQPSGNPSQLQSQSYYDLMAIRCQSSPNLSQSHANPVPIHQYIKSEPNANQSGAFPVPIHLDSTHSNLVPLHNHFKVNQVSTHCQSVPNSIQCQYLNNLQFHANHLDINQFPVNPLLLSQFRIDLSIVRPCLMNPPVQENP